MKKTIFAFLLLIMTIVHAQTIFHYNMPCGEERYFKNDSQLLVVRTIDSMMVLSQYSINGILITEYTGNQTGHNEFFLSRDDEMAKAELIFQKPDGLNFITMDNDGLNKKTYFFENVPASEMIPFNYLCYTAHRAIYFESENGLDSVVMFIQRRYPVPAPGLSESDSMAFVNAVLAHKNGLPNDFRYPEDLVKNADIMLVQDYTSLYETGEMEPDYTANWEFNDDVDVVLNQNGLIVTINSLYEYSGGVHGNFNYFCHVYDFKSGNIVVFDDIFTGDYNQVLTELINKKVRDQFEIPADESFKSRGFFVDEIPLTENFALYKDYILFVYNIYEIAPFSMGSIEVEILYTDLKEYVRKDGPIYRLMQ